MPGKNSKAKAAVQAPADPHPLFKPAPPPRNTHEPTKHVVDEYVKVVGVENVAGTGIQVLDCALSVNEINGFPAIPEDVCSVREGLQNLQQENGEPLKHLLRVNLQAGSVALTKGVLSNFALGLDHRLSPAPLGIILHLSAKRLTALFAMMHVPKAPNGNLCRCTMCRMRIGKRRRVTDGCGETPSRCNVGKSASIRTRTFFSGSPNLGTGWPTERFSPWVDARH